jgi:hypothetical protein
MKMNRLLKLLNLLLILSCGSACFGQTSTPAEYKELGELMVGRWASQITLIADWPEFSLKQGDEVNGYSTISWVSDKHGFQQEELIAEGVETSLYYWDVASKSIKAQRVSSAGSIGATTYWSKDGGWHWRHVCTQRDGKVVKGSGRLLFEDGGKTMIAEGTVYLDDEELPPYRDVYKRVGND